MCVHQTILWLVVSTPHFWMKPSSYKRKPGVVDGIQYFKHWSMEIIQTQIPQTLPKHLSNAGAISPLHHCPPLILGILNSEIREWDDNWILGPQELHKGPEKSWTRCCAAQTPAGRSKHKPEEHQQVSAWRGAQRGYRPTQWTPGWRTDPRQISAQVASAFLQLALLLQAGTGDLPLLLPPVPNQSWQCTEMSPGRNGNVKSRTSLSVGVTSTGVGFFFLQ